MLKRLKIENLLLIKEAEVLFDCGFTVITGETGSGKTILLQALKFVCGERAESDAVREGSLKAVIEAEFESPSSIAEILEEAGIEWEGSSPLLLKREITREGKSRAFINCQSATLSVLQKIAKHLVTFTDQHAYHTLKTEQVQRDFLDCFGSLHEVVLSAKSAFLVLRKSQDHLQDLRVKKESQARLLETIEQQISEIEEASLKEGEEERVAEEHHRLSKSQDLVEKGAVLEKLSESTLAQVKKVGHLLPQMAAVDRAFEEWVALSQEITMNLSEFHRFLLSYLSRIDTNPQHFAALEDRLSVLENLKRKYKDPLLHLKQLQAQKLEFLDLDETIDQAEKKTKEDESSFSSRAQKRFEERKKAASALSKEIAHRLKGLNIPHAEFFIEIDHHPEEDTVLFSLKANLGQPKTALNDHVSGGELSRVLLSLQLALGEHFPTPTMIFDEIDANIGGETATGIAEAFLELGKNTQVLAITHFPQVAKLAEHHIRIGKHFAQEETTTLLERLDVDERRKELTRMLGGIK